MAYFGLRSEGVQYDLGKQRSASELEKLLAEKESGALKQETGSEAHCKAQIHIGIEASLTLIFVCVDVRREGRRRNSLAQEIHFWSRLGHVGTQDGQILQDIMRINENHIITMKRNDFAGAEVVGHSWFHTTSFGLCYIHCRHKCCGCLHGPGGASLFDVDVAC